MKNIVFISISAMLLFSVAACSDTAVGNDLWDNVTSSKVTSNKQITSFTINGYKARISGTTVKAVLPKDTPVTSLTPVINHNGAAISPESGTAQDFSSPVTYTVTATDGTTEKYTVSVTILDAAGMANANLSVLKVKKGKLQPDFSSSQISYLDAPIPFSDSANPAYNAKQSNSVIADPEILIATMTINGTPVENAQEYLISNLAVGPNNVEIKVTSADKTTTNTYSVTMYRAIPIFKTGAGYYSGINPLEDGATQRGVSWPNPRFKDNGNGTVTDIMTGLTWLKNAKQLSLKKYVDAVSTAKSLSGSYGYEDWALPNINEIRSLINFNESPHVYLNKFLQNFSNIEYWWTSTTYINESEKVYSLIVNNGVFSIDGTNETLYAWAVSGESKNLPKTGQIESYNLTPGFGDDGDLEKGITWPIPRFHSNIEGTVIDNMTSLMWVNNQIYAKKGWIPTLEYINENMNTGIIDNYGFDDWTIPNAKEIETLSNFGKADITWLNESGLFVVASGKWIWTSNHSTSSSSQARFYNTVAQAVLHNSKDSDLWVLPVRQAKIINY
ncbi:MAG TPA: DUF1566 domain-containing protein [Spirochaetota bacterium]|nr:DUF1566 domain-containing protein [Spirochaetota bacterium]